MSDIIVHTHTFPVTVAHLLWLHAHGRSFSHPFFMQGTQPACRSLTLTYSDLIKKKKHNAARN